MWVYRKQHKCAICAEPRWRRHSPLILERMPGSDQVNKTHFLLPLSYGEAPELIEQYVKAFEKIWAHRAELARA